MNIKEKNFSKNVVLVGDFSLHNNHFGCHLVSQTFREQFARVGINLIARLPIDFNSIENHKQILEAADLVVINGEGAIHHGRYQKVIDLAANYPCVLVNSVYENNPYNKNLQKFKLITTRESLSAKALKNHHVEAKVVPDVIFASSYLRSFKPKRNLILKETGFTDSAKKSVLRLGPLKIRYRIGYSPKSNSLNDYLNFLYSHKKMAIGRFHSLICCSIFEIPFSSWESNTWKIKGLMHDMGISNLHFSTRKEALNSIPDKFPDSARGFCNLAKFKVESLFDEIMSLS
jgi:hypothetical protein